MSLNNRGVPRFVPLCHIHMCPQKSHILEKGPKAEARMQRDGGGGDATMREI